MSETSQSLPASVQPRLQVSNIFWITVVHLLAAYTVFWHFSWTGVALAFALHFSLATIGVTLTYHRLLTHRGFKVPRWLEYALATIGTLSAQGPLMIWVAEHRLHHRYSDTEKDPHDVRRGFFYAHMGHLFYHKDFEDDRTQWLKYVPDMAQHRYYHFLNDYSVLVALLTLPVLYWAGGWEFVLWGGFVRAVIMLHATWFVNSACHMWGYKNYPSRDLATNCWWAAILAAGEGWHNNHHSQPAVAAHGHKWWEFDLTWIMIRLLERLGLAWDIKRPAAWLAGAASSVAAVPVTGEENLGY